jgi:hypothetical protein
VCVLWAIHPSIPSGEVESLGLILNKQNGFFIKEYRGTTVGTGDLI